MCSRFLSICAVLSLALLVALSVAWVWSYIRTPAESAELARLRELVREAAPEVEQVAQSRQQWETVKRKADLNMAQDMLDDLLTSRPVRSIRCWSDDHMDCFVVSSRGWLGFVQEFARPTATASGDATIRAPGRWKIDGDSAHIGRPQIDFGYRQRFGRLNINGWQIGQRSFAPPYWLLCLPTLVAPSLWLRCRRRVQVAIRQNRCITCGYDLRASPDRCPECGTARTYAC